MQDRPEASADAGNDRPARPGPSERRPAVYVVSDALGETAELVTRAAASQFDGVRMEVRRIPYVDDEAAVRQAVARARDAGAAVVFTLIRPSLRVLMRDECQRWDVPCVDLMSPMLEALGAISGASPRLEPGLIHRLDAEYFARIEAVEFAVRCDDGRDTRSLPRADATLVGVSRCSKTPVSMYLAHRGLRVANVPLVPEVEVPAELFDLPAGRVVGLSIEADKLRDIRRERLRTLGLGPDAIYADMDRIRQELGYAQRIFRRLGCPVVDVSSRAVEETANRVLEIVMGGDRP